MSKRLSDMSLEELWELFPIILTPHNPLWSYWAKEEMESLSELLADYNPIVNHIGSTAIPAIMAKPIVDILIELSPQIEWQPIIDNLQNNGYICMSQSDSRVSFNKGYTPDGYADKVFHIHLHRIGDNDEIIFRNYLIEHPEVAKDYERIKLSLLPRFKHNRDSYTESKTEFVRKIVAQAKNSSSS